MFPISHNLLGSTQWLDVYQFGLSGQVWETDSLEGSIYFFLSGRSKRRLGMALRRRISASLRSKSGAASSGRLPA